MTISANIRQLRKKAGLTQIELAEKLGVSIATLRRWEAGETSPNGARMMELAGLLEVSPDEIVASAENSAAGQTMSAGNSKLMDRSNGMLVFEGDGTRIELPPTDKGYELFSRLVENLLSRPKS